MLHVNDATSRSGHYHVRPLPHTTHYLLPSTHYLLPSTHYLRPDTYYLLTTSYASDLCVNDSQSRSGRQYKLTTFSDLLLPTDYLPPAISYLLFTTDYLRITHYLLLDTSHILRPSFYLLPCRQNA